MEWLWGPFLPPSWRTSSCATPKRNSHTLTIFLQECQIPMLSLCFLLPRMADIPVYRSRSIPVDDRNPFIGIEIIKNKTKLETQVYRKSTNTSLLLHFHSHTDKRYKDPLFGTMLHRAYALSSTTEAFNEECAKLRSIFSRLDYPWSLTDSVISKFDSRNPSVSIAERNTEESNIVRINVPFKDQISANAVTACFFVVVNIYSFCCVSQLVC